MMDVLAGIFVGGRGERLGGIAKGMLRTRSGMTLIERWREIFDTLRVEHVLVGRHPAYEELAIETIADASADGGQSLGPLGGVVALLERASERRGFAIAVACDMPFVSAALVRRLIDAPPAMLVAPRRRGRWEPFFARYDAAATLPIALSLANRPASLQLLFDRAQASALPLAPEEEALLDDWDRPEDLVSWRPP
jgi:molybdopterin-guanine dinucleotide biosynthesis protein A